jgi:hypothetical protein
MKYVGIEIFEVPDRNFCDSNESAPLNSGESQKNFPTQKQKSKGPFFSLILLVFVKNSANLPFISPATMLDNKLHRNLHFDLRNFYFLFGNYFPFVGSLH